MPSRRELMDWAMELGIVVPAWPDENSQLWQVWEDRVFLAGCTGKATDIAEANRSAGR
jgi:hypothetical protein